MTVNNFPIFYTSRFPIGLLWRTFSGFQIVYNLRKNWAKFAFAWELFELYRLCIVLYLQYRDTYTYQAFFSWFCELLSFSDDKTYKCNQNWRKKLKILFIFAGESAFATAFTFIYIWSIASHLDLPISMADKRDDWFQWTLKDRIASL